MKADRLLEMKQEIERANLDIARLYGQVENFEKQLMDSCGTKELSQAQEKINAKKKSLEKKIINFEKDTEKLIKKYPWTWINPTVSGHNPLPDKLLIIKGNKPLIIKII